MPVVVTLGVVGIKSALANKFGYTVNVMVVLTHGGDNTLHNVYVATVVPVNPEAGVNVYCPVEELITKVPVPAVGWL